MNAELQEIIFTALGTVLTGLIGYGFFLLRTFTLSKIRNEELKTIAEVSFEIVGTAVADVSENFVKELKKDGKFSKEDARTALELAKSKAKQQISKRAKELIEKHHGDFEKWLEQQIESFVAH